MYSYIAIYQLPDDRRGSIITSGKNWVDVVGQIKEKFGVNPMMVHMTLIEEAEEVTPLAERYGTLWSSSHKASDFMFLPL